MRYSWQRSLFHRISIAYLIDGFKADNNLFIYYFHWFSSMRGAHSHRGDFFDPLGKQKMTKLEMGPIQLAWRRGKNIGERNSLQAGVAVYENSSVHAEHPGIEHVFLMLFPQRLSFCRSGTPYNTSVFHVQSISILDNKP